MDTETIEERSIQDLKEILSRLGGWPVLEGEEWRGQEEFRWWELSVKAGLEGFSTDRILSIGGSEMLIDCARVPLCLQLPPRTLKTPREE